MDEEKVGNTQGEQNDTPPDEKQNAQEKSTETESEPGKGREEKDNVKWQAALAYLPLVCLIPLLLNRDDPFIQRHAKQGFVLFMVIIIAWLLKMFDMFWNLIIYICLAAALVGAVAILIKGDIRIPLLSDLADKIRF